MRIQRKGNAVLHQQAIGSLILLSNWLGNLTAILWVSIATVQLCWPIVSRDEVELRAGEGD